MSSLGEIDIEPDVCPLPGNMGVERRFCLRTFITGEVSECVYAYGFTESTAPSERIDHEVMLRWMTARGNRYKRVRVLCLAAKAVDRAGA